MNYNYLPNNEVVPGVNTNNNGNDFLNTSMPADTRVECESCSNFQHNLDTKDEIIKLMTQDILSLENEIKVIISSRTSPRAETWSDVIIKRNRTKKIPVENETKQWSFNIATTNIYDVLNMSYTGVDSVL